MHYIEKKYNSHMYLSQNKVHIVFVRYAHIGNNSDRVRITGNSPKTHDGELQTPFAWHVTTAGVELGKYVHG